MNVNGPKMVKLVVTCLMVLVASAQISAMTVTSLNKEIAVNPKSGLVTISADGETLAEVRHTYPVKVKATGKMWWPGMHKPKLATEGDKAIFDEDVSNDGKTWHQYHVEMEEVEKGLL